MFSLRERGIYLAPDGTRLIASHRRHLNLNPAPPSGAGAQFYLYSGYAWSFHGQADYRVLDCGCLKLESSAGNAPPPWQVADLRDTDWLAGAH